MAEERWRQIERRINEELAKLNPMATQAEIDAVIEKHGVPKDWEWVDIQAVGGPPQIVITRA